ncbi:MAG: V-type ATPase 116kDa subunit family protein [Sulfolobales archaeon]
MFNLISYPERLKYVRIITLRDYADDLTSILHELGVIHLEELKNLPEEDLKILKGKLASADEVVKLLRFVEGYVGTTRLVEVRGDLNIAELENEFFKTLQLIKSLKDSVEAIANNISEVSDRLNRYEATVKYLLALSRSCGDVLLTNLNFEGDLIFTKLVKTKPEQINTVLSTLQSVKALCIAELSEGEVLVNYLGFKEDLSKFKELIDYIKAEVIEIPQLNLSVSEFIKELESKITASKRTLNELELELKKLVNENLELIAKAKVLQELYVERVETILKSVMSEYSYVVEGWVPEKNYEVLINTVYSKFKYVYIEELRRSDVGPPTKLSNSAPVKYFELITRLYGIPRYEEWDPTTLITYSFFVFFGLMMADAVYGIAMILIIKYVLDRLGFVENPYSEGYVNLKKMLLVLGVSAVFFGFLTNTYAGYSIPYYTPLINVADPLLFISLALIIGLVHVNLAHFLGVVRALKMSDRATLLSELGLLIAEFAALPYILYYFLNIRLLPLSQTYYDLLLYTSLAGVAMLVIGKFLSLKSVGLFLWIFDLTGVLGDVFSYTRLAGIGLATYLMARNFNDLALMTANAIHSLINIPVINVVIASLIALIVILLTNTINLAFGIIGSFVHSLRLCFVEFLPKFYEGGGREFKPLKIRLSKYVVVGSS